MKKSIKWWPTLALLFACFCPLYADVYKWTDSEGNIIYGDTPPSHEAEKMDIKTRSVEQGKFKNRMKKRHKLLDVMQEERNEKMEQKKKAAEQKVRQEAVCKRLNAELEAMQNASYLYEETDDPFNPKILSDERRNQEQEKYQDYIDEHC